MKKLYLLRHAKTEPAGPAVTDFERRLTDAGRESAAAVGRSMADRDIEPDVIVSSPAARARETAEIVRDAAGITADVRFEPAVYEAETRALLEVLALMDDDAASVMIVGHNPGMEDLARALTGKLVPMSTATLCAADLHIGRWAEIRSAKAELTDVIQPV